MLIKLLISRVVMMDGDRSQAQNAGEEIEVDSAEAARMIEAEQAIPVRARRAERAVVGQD